MGKENISKNAGEGKGSGIVKLRRKMMERERERGGKEERYKSISPLNLQTLEKYCLSLEGN